MIDTHCHLTFPDFAGRVDEVIARAAERGVTGMITISTTSEDCVHALEIATLYDNVWCSAGIHPLYSDRGRRGGGGEDREGRHDWDQLRRVARHERCVAWGELGLDNHYDKPPRSIQDRVLHEQLAFIESCRDEGIERPIVVHCREAFEDLIPIFRSTSLDPTRFVFHCFTGGPGDARLVLDFGAMISFTGVVTYRNAPEVRDAARLVPLDRIMVETDAPFLSPEPNRGRRPCEPSMVCFTARWLAEERGEAWDTFHESINANTARFFGIEVPG